MIGSRGSSVGDDRLAALPVAEILQSPFVCKTKQAIETLFYAPDEYVWHQTTLIAAGNGAAIICGEAAPMEERPHR